MNLISQQAVSQELTEVLFREAAHLDDGDFEAWLAMMHPEIEYVAPIRQDLAPAGDEPPPPGHRLAFFTENITTLAARVAKVRTGLLQTEVPSSRVVRLITNVIVSPGDEAGRRPVRSAFLVHRQHRQRDIEVLAGRREDLWMQDTQGWKLRRREILFAANVLPVSSLPLFY